jgi:hypothetical protein
MIALQANPTTLRGTFDPLRWDAEGEGVVVLYARQRAATLGMVVKAPEVQYHHEVYNAVPLESVLVDGAGSCPPQSSRGENRPRLQAGRGLAPPCNTHIRRCETLAVSTSAPVSSDQDAWILRDVDRALADGFRLLHWWERKDAGRSYKTSFSFLRDLTPPDRAIGFFDRAEISSGPIGVMGLAHEMLFDQPKAGSPETYRAQIREFVLHYFLRVAEITPPQASRALGIGPGTGFLLNLLHMGPPRMDVRGGFRYTQLYYKEAATGRIGAFPMGRRNAIVDLREIGPKYEWIVLRARPFDYELDVAPVGAAGPRLVLPLPDSPTIAINRQLIIDEDNPEPGILGRYGFAYALLDDPEPRGAQVYGPAQYKACFQRIHFEVLSSGESRVHLSFTGNMPDKILDVKVDPIGLFLSSSDLLSFGLSSRLLQPVQGLLSKRFTFGSFDPLLGFISLANIATAGLASKALDISKQQLFRDILAKHFQIYYQLILDSLLAYRQVSDWRDPTHLPEWAREGGTE